MLLGASAELGGILAVEGEPILSEPGDASKVRPIHGFRGDSTSRMHVVNTDCVVGCRDITVQLSFSAINSRTRDDSHVARLSEFRVGNVWFYYQGCVSAMMGNENPHNPTLRLEVHLSWLAI